MSYDKIILRFCRCCESKNLFNLFGKNKDKHDSFNLCLNCFNVQREEFTTIPTVTNEHIDPEWLHRYLISKYNEGRLDLKLLEVRSDGSSRLEKFNDINIRSAAMDILSTPEESDQPVNFVLAENILDRSLNPKKTLDKLSDIVDQSSGIIILTVGTDVKKNISVFSAYSLSIIASRSGFGIVDIFKVKSDTEEIIVAFLKKFEAHSKSLDRLIQEEESDGRYNIGSYYENNYN